MKHLRMVSAILGIVVLLVSACDELEQSLQFTCGAIRFSYTIDEEIEIPEEFPVFTLVAVLEASGAPIGQATVPLTVGTHHVVINFNQTYPEGTLIALQIVVEDEVLEVSPGIPCSGGESVTLHCMINDGRLNALHCGSPLGVYCIDEGIDVYGVNPETGQGELLIRVSKEQIDAVGLSPTENLTIAEARGVLVSRLMDDKYQVTTHYPDGKLYAIAWRGCPATSEVEILAW